VADQHAFNAAEMCSKKASLSASFAFIVGGRLRVGFVSVEMHDRPVGRDLINLFESLDERLLEISCFCLYDLTPSKPWVQFEYRSRLQKVCFSIVWSAASLQSRAVVFQVCKGGFHDVSKDTFDAAASKINEAGVNIVVNLDGWTSAPTINEIFILKPARSSLNFKGYAGTLGAGVVDGLVADRVVTPPDLSVHYREHLLLMPNSFHYNGHSLLYPNPGSKYKSRSDVPALPQDEDSVVMCNWNQFYKFNPEMFSVYMRVMQELPNVYVWLMGWDSFTQTAFKSVPPSFRLRIITLVTRVQELRRGQRDQRQPLHFR
jgi:predicted O-linked N-acetylglucosamine transferase (SPINDLY family)